MAISVTTDLVDISSCDTTTTLGTFYRLNGVNSGNPAAEADAKIQGSACVAFKEGTTTGTTDTGGHFNSTATFDATGQHIFHWRLAVTAGNMLTKANQGVTFGLTNTSTTSTTAWSTTNYKKWYLDGSDTDTVGGWKCYVVDPAGTADASAGTLTLTTLKNCGFLNRQNTGVNTALNNAMVDAIRRGTGVTATASSSADTITFNSIFAVDATVANSWGVMTQVAGIYYGAGKINIGTSGQTNTCLFSDIDQVLVWRKYPVANTLYDFNLLGSASFKTTMQLTSSVVRGQAGQVWNITCGTNSEFKAYACSFANIRSAVLSSTSVLDGCGIDASGTIEANGATIVNCDFSNQTAAQLKVDTTAEMSVITNCSFASGGTGHAIQLGAAGTYDFDNLTFTGYAASNGSTGNEAVYVNVASGSVTLNINGGTTPSYRTAGATVTVVAGAVTVSLVVTDTVGTPIQDAQVMVACAAGGSLPYNASVTISNSGTTATVTHTSHGLSTNDKVRIKGASHAANNGVFSITVTGANTYTYTMVSAPGSNPTGTITSTFVVLSGATNASGEVSMSRVFPGPQPITGWARKSSEAPYYKTGLVSGTVSASTGASLAALLIADA